MKHLGAILLSVFVLSACATHKNTRGIASETEQSHVIHAPHDHKHGAKCGHKAVKHGNHMDYEHDGHYHSAHQDHTDDHGLIANK